MATEAQLGWAAGIVDGEGYIGLLPYKKQGYTSFCLRIQVAATSLLMVQRLHEIFPISRVRTRKTPRNRWRQQWEWRADSARAADILEQLLPHLVNKRREAEIALLSRRYMRWGRGQGIRNPHILELAYIDRELKRLKRAPDGDPSCLVDANGIQYVARRNHA